MKNLSKTKILCVSAAVCAMYIAVMYFTQSFAFGAYQIRIATGLYALGYMFPFLIVPLGIANGLGNFIGGLGLWDIVGGTAVGILTAAAAYCVKRFKLTMLLVIPIIVFIPGLIVPVWLSGILGLPYPVLAINLCVGQIFPAIVGYVLIKALIPVTERMM